MQIGEVARRAGISARMLRHYDELGIVSPSQRTPGGYREYTAEDIQRLFQAESLRSLGMSLRDLRRILDDPDFTPEALLRDLIRSTQERIRHEEALLRRLRGVEHSTAADWNEVLGVIALLRGLESDDPSRRQRSALATQDAGPGARVLAGALLVEQDPNVAGALRWALRRAGADALPVLADGLASADPSVRGRAVAALGDLEGADPARLLARALSDRDVAVRHAAALALGARGDAAAIPVLVEMVVVGDHDVDAAEVLGGLEHDEEVAGLIRVELGRAGASDAARRRVVQALAELDGPAAGALLHALADDADQGVRLTARALIQRRGLDGL